jgi:hypothetical protein
MINWPIQITHNKYSLWYENLVERAKSRILENSYTENHHIIPKSWGGSNSKKNLVQLTAREHYIAHLLLWKIDAPTDYHIKMSHAFNAMCIMKDSSLHNKPKYKINSRIFEKLKLERHIYYTTDPKVQERLKRVAREVGSRPKGENFKRLTGDRFRNRTDTRGELNGMFGRKHSPESIQKMKEALKTRVVKKETTEKWKATVEKNKQPCEYCRKICSLTAYKRFHGINCKVNKIQF